MENFSPPVPEDASDEALIQQFNNGRKEAFDALYYRHVHGVYKRVRYMVSESDIEDVIQEIFIAVLKSLPSFRGDSQFGTWLRTLTNYKVAEFYRKRNRKREPPIVSLTEGYARTGGNPPQAMEERMLIQRALQKLPENYREVILLRFAEDLQFHEIAAVMNQNLEATKSLFRRAISALRKHLDG